MGILADRAAAMAISLDGLQSSPGTEPPLVDPSRDPAILPPIATP